MGKKVATVIALVVILGGAVTLMIWRLGPPSPQREMARKAREAPYTAIVVDTLEKVTLTAAQWEAITKREQKTGYKIDSRGRRLSPIHKCVSCGAEIPGPPVRQPPGPGFEGWLRQEYKCPVCKKYACWEGLRPASEKETRPPDFTD